MPVPVPTTSIAIEKLLAELADVPASERTARFRCVVAMVQPDGTVHTADGACEGQIGFEPHGEHGFGYDPVFVVEGYGGQTMAELDPEVKNRISHRARAVEAVRPALDGCSSRQLESSGSSSDAGLEGQSAPAPVRPDYSLSRRPDRAWITAWAFRS